MGNFARIRVLLREFRLALPVPGFGAILSGLIFEVIDVTESAGVVLLENLAYNERAFECECTSDGP